MRVATASKASRSQCYTGDQHQYAEGKASLLAYLRGAVHRHAEQWIVWAGKHTQPVLGEGVEVASGEAAGNIEQFSFDIYFQLTPCTTDIAFSVVNNSPGGDQVGGLEGHHRPSLSKRAEEMEQNIFNTEALKVKYEGLAGKPLDECL